LRLRAKRTDPREKREVFLEALDMNKIQDNTICPLGRFSFFCFGGPPVKKLYIYYVK
jgi:hypothetical protein